MNTETPFLEISNDGDVVIARLTAKNFDSTNVESIAKQLFDLVDEKNCRKLIINLKKVDYVVSLAMGKLVTLHTKLRDRQGKLRLCELRPSVQEKIASTGLNQVFDIYADEATAIESVD